MNKKGDTVSKHASLGQVRPTPIITDPQGCYTGRPLELNEQPIQDADDL